MLKKAAALGLAFALLSAPMLADEREVPKGIPHLDHVFVIMMENHGYQQVINNPNEPFLNSLITNKQVPSLAFIAPNQCNDQHGRGNGDAFCAFDPGQPSLNGLTNGTQVGLNGGLILQGDTTIERIVNAIVSSPVWSSGRNAIVIVWDENDYSGISTMPNGLFPPQNQNTVVLTVQTNYDDKPGIQSGKFYDSFSLLKSLESGFDLPCLNHACDDHVKVMSDLFGGHHHHDDDDGN